jgi:hypothetical protein
MSDVPCEGCTACCRNVIMLLPEEGDNVASYDSEPVPNRHGGVAGYILRQREDGACVYLGDRGCTIYERRPRCAAPSTAGSSSWRCRDKSSAACLASTITSLTQVAGASPA